MPQFKIGDAVRVKADVLDIGVTLTPTEKANRHLVVNAGTPCYARRCGMKISGSGWSFDSDWLEPWNDAEEWNGSQWVAKKSEAKPCVIVRRGRSYAEHVESTAEAFRKAKIYAKADAGSEYVIYQEKGSEKVEPKSKAEKVAEIAKLPATIEAMDGTNIEVETISARVIGNEVIVVYQVKS